MEFSANAVVLQLTELARHLQILSDEMDDLEIKAVEAKEKYTCAYASKFLSITGAVEVRKQQCLKDTSEERFAADVAETMVKAHARKIATLKTRIDVGRSASALVRAEADLLNVRR